MNQWSLMSIVEMFLIDLQSTGNRTKQAGGACFSTSAQIFARLQGQVHCYKMMQFPNLNQTKMKMSQLINHRRKKINYYLGRH